MTLAAAILLLGVSSLTSWNWGLAAQSSQSSSSPSSASTPQEQTPPGASQTGTAKPNSEQTPNPPPTSQKPKSPAGKRRRKKVPPANCDPAPSDSTTSGSAPAAGSASGANQTSTAQKPCAPSKIVVRQGGISEQSIQLAGASNGDDASGKRDVANRMLAATEENLKKIAGRQLSPAEQDSASQIRQFVTQSKSAMATGDLERAQTLAWKAKLLSDDLINPGK